MSVTILARTYGAETDQRAVVDNDSFCRPFYIGRWNKIRVVVRLSINASANILGDPHYAVGFCSGPTVFNGATSQFVGMISNVVSGISMGYNAGPPAYFSSRHYVAKKVGTNITGTTGNYSDSNNSYATNSWLGYYEDGAGGFGRDFMAVTITRPTGSFKPTSGSYPVEICARSAVGFTDISFALFAAQAILPSPQPTGDYTNYTPASYLAGTGAVLADELAHGAFDHVMVGWDKASVPIEISDIGIVRLI